MVSFSDQLSLQKAHRQMTRSNSIGGITRRSRRQSSTIQLGKRSSNTDYRQRRRLSSSNVFRTIFKAREFPEFQKQRNFNESYFRTRQMEADFTTVNNVSSLLEKKLTIKPYYSLPSRGTLCDIQDQLLFPQQCFSNSENIDKDIMLSNRRLRSLNFPKENHKLTPVLKANADINDEGAKFVDVHTTGQIKDFVAPEYNSSEAVEINQNEHPEQELLKTLEINKMKQQLNISTEFCDNNNDYCKEINNGQQLMSRGHDMIHDNFDKSCVSLESCMSENDKENFSYDFLCENSNASPCNEMKSLNSEKCGMDKFEYRFSNYPASLTNLYPLNEMYNNDSNQNAERNDDFMSRDKYNDDKTHRNKDNNNSTEEHNIHDPFLVEYLTPDAVQHVQQTSCEKSIWAAEETETTKLKHRNGMDHMSEYLALRRQDTVVLDEEDDNQDNNREHINLFQSLKNILCRKISDDNNPDISIDDEDEIDAEPLYHSNSYKNLLTHPAHFRCAVCGSNLEIPSFQLFDQNLENDDFSCNHHKEGCMPVELYCPVCCCGRNIYHPL
uniref:Uncharacterized protein n=1 Tax=Arion vulgaris TaxID=1028688 RepID=A0A0B6ZVD8_9EUPU